MDQVAIKNATRRMDKPRDWDDSLDGPCGALVIKDTLLNGSSCMASQWMPNAYELLLLNAGHPVTLFVIGTQHPPVALAVMAEVP